MVQLIQVGIELNPAGHRSSRALAGRNLSLAYGAFMLCSGSACRLGLSPQG